MISRVSSIFAEHNVNIANLKLSRDDRGGVACCVIEADGFIPEVIESRIRRIPNIISTTVINENGGEAHVS